MEENTEVVEQELPAEQPEPAQEATAPETPEVKEPEKTFTQSELDEILEKRLARERRKAEREAAVVPRQPAPIDPATIQTQEELIEFRAHEKAVELIKKQEQARAYSSFFEKEEEAAETMPDYHQVTRSIPLTEDTLAAAMAADNSTDVLYHLGKNPKEAVRIAALPVYLQGFEVAKISHNLATAPKAVAPSKAPPPVTPVGSHGAATKPPERMTQAEFDEHRRKVKSTRR
jgi:hypothetical protein